jgi:ubiquitin
MTECPYGRRYWDTQNDDACRMCELRDICPLEPELEAEDNQEPEEDNYDEMS